MQRVITNFGYTQQWLVKLECFVILREATVLVCNVNVQIKVAGDIRYCEIIVWFRKGKVVLDVVSKSYCSATFI